MSLAAIFLGGAPLARRARFAEAPGLEDGLAQLVTKGRAAWPAIALAETDFAAFLGRCLPEDAAEDVAALRGGDLWLACAYGRGVPGAAEALERHGFASISRTLARLGAPAPLIADVLQELRGRLVEMQAPQPDQKVYAGRGDLVGWLRVSAVREMNHRRNRLARELPFETRPTLVASPLHEPELALLRRTHKRELSEAFKEALASMSSRERNLLRYHFIENLTAGDIGRLYGVHRATAARWISRARQTLCERTRDCFTRRVSTSEEGFQRVVALIESEVHVQLAAVAT
jgi:RNA polymerase sigma-70 factor (ECF subfamily)